MANSFEREWINSLPQHIREMLDICDETLNDFAGNARMAETLSKISFKRAIDGVVEATSEVVETDDDVFFGDIATGLTEADVNMRIDLALRANKEAARIKEQRIRMIDEFEEVQDVPKPANINFHVVESTAEDQIAKLKEMGFYREARELEEELELEFD